MSESKRKIINDPVYGFIVIDHPLIFKIITHPYYQRLRRINQMALAYLVYPGAVHSRFHHSLGAYHLMCGALTELCSKGVEITADEQVAAKAAILLHDIGHGPFSHALEGVLVKGVHHESLSLHIMRLLNEEFKNELSISIEIFTNRYPKKFLYQLISGQLDVDRMDYLTRDSFFTGVSEGVIGYDRIVKMLSVKEGSLVVEEKGIYSIEKFLVARRLMYWQVYLHKTVLVAEKMLIRIIERARELVNKNISGLTTATGVDFFIRGEHVMMNNAAIQSFIQLDDIDVMHAIKLWSVHPDIILSKLCKGIINRDLLKIKLAAEPFSTIFMEQKTAEVCKKLSIDREQAHYFVFKGNLINTMYAPQEERINILFKDGSVRDISQVDNALVHKTLTMPVKKFYICYFN